MDQYTYYAKCDADQVIVGFQYELIYIISHPDAESYAWEIGYILSKSECPTLLFGSYAYSPSVRKRLGSLR